MAFQFPKDKETHSQAINRIIMNQIHSYSPIYRVQQKLDGIRSSAYWGMEIYYYFLEKLLRNIRSELNHVAHDWAIPDWEEASKLVDEPEDILEGLKKIQQLSQKYCTEELEHLAIAIQIFTAIKSMKH